MAVTAQSGVFSFGPQSAKGVAPTNWYRHKAINIDLGIQDDVRLGQLEVGGVPVPTFPYKAGYVVGGGANLQPRLESTLGWLLYGAMGRVTTTAAYGNPDVYDHVFDMSADATAVPWMGMRKYIPMNNADTATDVLETYTDAKVLGLAFQMGADTPLNARLDCLGINFELGDADGTYANAYEDWQSIPVACQTAGYLKVGGTDLPVVQASFSWQNQPLDIRQEKVIGQPQIDDVTIITRQLAVDFLVKYNDAALYREVLTGSPTGTAWSGTPFTGSFDVKTVSSVNMTGETEPYSLIAKSDSIQLQQVGGITLGAGQAVMMRFQGVALDVAGNYCSFTLRNKVADYTWPV